MRWLLYLATGGAALAMVVAGWQVAQSPDAAFDDSVPPASIIGAAPTEKVTITIAEGEDAKAMASKLERAGVIRSGLRFRVLTALKGVENRLGAGEYRLEKGMPVTRVIDILRRGPLAQRLVTIREGLRAEEVGAILEEKGIVPREEFLLAVAIDYRSEFDFLADLPPGATVEGYLFPDTYDFPREAKAEGVVRLLLANFGSRFGPTLRQEAAQRGLTIHQVVTLGAIVEREAQVAEERPLIASVFLQRLALGTTLDADPTLQYALGSDPRSVAGHGYWKRDLTVQDLRLDSPYNTYRQAGLPPGPIASPGLASLTAVVRPAATNFLYFVAKPDGSHAFARTLEEHGRNVQRYRGQ